ncbi:hypothetical protein [Nesterenkonia pannonica]|uniref:hypothetical protein n=1 Tax=Nesterenkonia pannonica TaxID=1548602 RepID=UPI00216431B6|nr:hypothetical protein [Nesterenkonia pannonica]
MPLTEDPQVIAESVAERSLGADIQDVDDGEQAGPDWTVISAPEDYGEDFYRVDTTGLRDDAQMGDRLFIYVEESADGYELTQVEATNLCRRGVTDEGLCL